ncbi:hypothetical protein [Faecalitalea cylindroides]|uniref:hypothetical protein n=1 Tax=Faecalitalea cylindroides TaxID=39483 RepID=UPI001957AC99|nr:hypothetical protein [Faecalitalea cylindroides]MBM6652916.1 hypothetical protein [Faecalitalea cylindroides]
MKKFLLPLFLCIAATFNVAPIYAQEYASLEHTTSPLLNLNQTFYNGFLKQKTEKCTNVYGMHLKTVGKPIGF